jgi:hypothetical protein
MGGRPVVFYLFVYQQTEIARRQTAPQNRISENIRVVDNFRNGERVLFRLRRTATYAEQDLMNRHRSMRQTAGLSQTAG